ncbi:MAG: glycosyltransferase [Candidatus Paceibacterota bacterium]|jgi:glycosyltransferase involved in cell wall biosynthesis
MQYNKDNGTDPKICYLVTLGTWGGAQRYVYDLGLYFSREKFTISLITGTPGLLVEKFKSENIETSVITELGRNIKPLSDLIAFFRIITLLKKERPEILHVNSSKGGGIGALAGRIVGTKNIVFTAHGWAFNEDRPIIEKAVITFLHWLTVILSHKTIAVSEAVATRIKNLPFAKNKIVVIKNSVSQMSITERSESRSFIEKYTGKSLGKNTIVVGTISELNKNKDIFSSIEAISLLKKEGLDVIFVVFGEGSERASLEKLIAELSLKDAVFLLGFNERASSLISGFDIFTLTSITESLGYVLLEAGLAKVPVVATAVGGIPEVIENNVTGLLVKPRSPSEISHAIKTLLENKELAEKLASRLHEKVLVEFSPQRMLRETKKVYGEY